MVWRFLLPHVCLGIDCISNDITRAIYMNVISSHHDMVGKISDPSTDHDKVWIQTQCFFWLATHRYVHCVPWQYDHGPRNISSRPSYPRKKIIFEKKINTFPESRCIKSLWKIILKVLAIILCPFSVELHFWMHANNLGPTLVQVKACCHQSKSYYLGKCWPRFCHHMASVGNNEYMVNVMKHV